MPSDETPTFKEVTTGQITINKLGGRAVSNSTQTISSAAVTVVELDAVDFEHSDVVDVDTANNKLVVQKDGVYDIKGKIKFDENTGDGTRILVRMSLNGADFADYDLVMGGTSTTGIGVSDVKDLSANDEIQLKVFQDSGSSKDLDGSERVSLAVTREG